MSYIKLFNTFGELLLTLLIIGLAIREPEGPLLTSTVILGIAIIINTCRILYLEHLIKKLQSQLVKDNSIDN